MKSLENIPAFVGWLPVGLTKETDIIKCLYVLTSVTICRASCEMVM